MTENAIFQPSRDPLTIALLVLPQASILEVASALDPLRNANRQLGHEAYRWRVVSPDGAPVPLTCGIELPSSGPLSHAVGAEALIVAAGYRLADVATRPLIHDLRRIAPRFALVGGIDAAPWVLARAGLLDGYRATVHWEDLEDLAASHPHIDVVPDRFVIDRNRVTIAGAAPAADFMLHLIRSRHGAAQVDVEAGPVAAGIRIAEAGQAGVRPAQKLAARLDVVKRTGQRHSRDQRRGRERAEEYGFFHSYLFLSRRPFHGPCFLLVRADRTWVFAEGSAPHCCQFRRKRFCRSSGL